MGEREREREGGERERRGREGEEGEERERRRVERREEEEGYRREGEEKEMLLSLGSVTYHLFLPLLHSYPESVPVHDSHHHKHNGFKRNLFKRHKRKTVHGSRSLSSSDNNLSRGSGNLAKRGRSRSNLSLGHAPSMTSVVEEPRRSISNASE